MVFSGLTVAASLSVLFVFPYPFLSSFAYAGIAVVIVAVLGAGVLLPAALTLLGRRACRPGAERGDGNGFWFRISNGVLRRPLVSGGAGLLAVLVLGTWLSVVPTGQRLANDPVGLVADVRELDAPFDVLVGGYPAELSDYRDGVVQRLPLVTILIVLVTFVVLFLMTGSVLAPVKAAALNLLSLSVMFGVLVWGFQDGGLADLLGFTPTGAVEPSIPILMFCIAYGLSMDYEVFLLSRIREDYLRTGDPVGSVPRGIGASAGLVTAAALVLAASFALYATSEVVFLQQLGIGMALTVAVDATVIRGVLVPALMRLAGRGNWWAPAPLRRLHDRIGPREHQHGGRVGRL